MTTARARPGVHQLPVGLRDRGRVRRRLPRGDRAARPAGARDRPRARDTAPRRPRRRARAGAALSSCRRASISRSSIPASACGAARASRCARAREGRVLVGPDNGLLTLAAERLGGVVEAVDISDSPERLRPICATFHGRDVFAPVAAALADGTPLQALGSRRRRRTLVALELPARERRRAGAARARRCTATSSATSSLDATAEQLPRLGSRRAARFAVDGGRRRRPARWARTFAECRPASCCSTGTRAEAGAGRQPRVGGASCSASARRRAVRARAPRADERAVSPARGARARHPRLHLRTDSTNARARELAIAGAPHGTLVTALEQSAGRGRQGRSWSAPAGQRAAGSLVLRDPPRAAPARRRASRSASSPAPSALHQVAERRRARAARRAVASSPGSCRGPPAGGLGGARDRRERGRAPGGAARRSCAQQRAARWGAGPRRRARARRLLRALERRLAEPADATSRRGASATRCCGRAVAGTDGQRRSRAASTAPGGWSCARRRRTHGARRRRGAPAARRLTLRPAPSHRRCATAARRLRPAALRGRRQTARLAAALQPAVASARAPAPPASLRTTRLGPGRSRGDGAVRRPRLERRLVRRHRSVLGRPAAEGSPPVFAPLRRRRALRARRLGKLRSSSRASAGGLRAIRVRAPRSTSSASGVCASAAASSAAARRRSCLRAAWISRRALRAWAAPEELTSSPSRRLVSGQRWTAYSSCTSRVYSAIRQIHALAWSRRPIRRSTSARSMILAPSRRSSRGQRADDVDRRVERVGVAQRGDLGERPQAQRRVRVALDRGDQEAALQLAVAVEVQHRPRAAPAVGRTRAPASAAHTCCSP